jgi:hypothetical protein
MEREDLADGRSNSRWDDPPRPALAACRLGDRVARSPDAARVAPGGYTPDAVGVGAVDSGATDPMGVCLVSSASALCPGGISAYVRALTEQLADRDHVSAIARFAQSPPRLLDYASSEPTRVVHCHGRPITIIAPGRGWTPVLRRLKRFLGRPVSSPLAGLLCGRPARSAPVPTRRRERRRFPEGSPP